MQISFLKGSLGDGRTKLVTTEVQRGQAEKDVHSALKLPHRDFSRVCEGVTSTHISVGVLEEFKAVRNNGGMS